jgi:hypothetical protein
VQTKTFHQALFTPPEAIVVPRCHSAAIAFDLLPESLGKTRISTIFQPMFFAAASHKRATGSSHFGLAIPK